MSSLVPEVDLRWEWPHLLLAFAIEYIIAAGCKEKIKVKLNSLN